jgi:DNA-binding MarR family transcriptional regulator
MDKDVKHVDNKLNAVNLLQLLDRAYAGLGDTLLQALSQRHSLELSRSDLKLLANLDCGTTYTSELARRLGVSRQAINQLLRRPIEQGIIRLETIPDRRNTKWIVMTDYGIEVIGAALKELERIERDLMKDFGSEAVNGFKQISAIDWTEYS